MSDFLERLVARTLEPASAVRPLVGGARPPTPLPGPIVVDPLFPETAPDPRMDGSTPGSQAASMTSARDCRGDGGLRTPVPATDSRFPDTEGRRQESAPPPAPTHGESSHRMPPAEAPPPETHPPRVPAGGLASIVPAGATPYRPEASAPRIQPPHPKQPSLLDQPSPEPPVPIHRAAPTLAAMATLDDAPEPEPVSGHRPVPSPGPAADTPPARPVAPPTTSIEDLRRRVQTARAATTADAAAVRISPPEPTPSAAGEPSSRVADHRAPAFPVSVTIGRVEVRALLTPSDPSKRPAPPRPRLSLDDYLKQRNTSRR